MSNRGFTIITYDNKILDERVSIEALKETEAKMIFITFKLNQKRLRDQIMWFLKYWPKMREYAETMKSSDLVRVHLNGRIVPVEPKKRSTN